MRRARVSQLVHVKPRVVCGCMHSIPSGGSVLHLVGSAARYYEECHSEQGLNAQFDHQSEDGLLWTCLALYQKADEVLPEVRHKRGVSVIHECLVEAVVTEAIVRKELSRLGHCHALPHSSQSYHLARTAHKQQDAGEATPVG